MIQRLFFVYFLSTFLLFLQPLGVQSLEDVASSDVYTLSVPEDIGSITERYVGDSEQMMICIQEPCACFAVQKNVQRIIAYLAHAKQVELICLEGVEGDVHLDSVREIPSCIEKENIVNSLMAKGAVSGAEASYILFSETPDISGIDLMDTYNQQRDIEEKTREKRATAVALLEKFEGQSAQFRAAYFHNEIARFDALQSDYLKKNLSLLEYSEKLLLFAAEVDVDISIFPNMTLFLELALLRKSIGVDTLRRECSVLLEALRALPSSTPSVSMIEAMEECARVMNETHFTKYTEMEASLCEAVLSIMKSDVFVSSQYPQSMDFFKSNVLLSRLDVSSVERESHALVKMILERLRGSEEKKELLYWYENIRFLIKLMTFSIDADEWMYYQECKGKFTQGYFDEITKRYKLRNAPAWSFLDTDSPFIEQYYTLAIKRSQHIAEESLRVMKLTEVARLGIVVRGFHANELTRMWREKNVSYVVITPRQKNNTLQSMSHGDDAERNELEKTMRVSSNVQLVYNEQAVPTKNNDEGALLGVAVLKGMISQVLLDLYIQNGEQQLEIPRIPADWVGALLYYLAINEYGGYETLYYWMHKDMPDGFLYRAIEETVYRRADGVTYSSFLLVTRNGTLVYPTEQQKEFIVQNKKRLELCPVRIDQMKWVNQIWLRDYETHFPDQKKTVGPYALSVIKKVGIPRSLQHTSMTTSVYTLINMTKDDLERTVSHGVELFAFSTIADLHKAFESRNEKELAQIVREVPPVVADRLFQVLQRKKEGEKGNAIESEGSDMKVVLLSDKDFSEVNTSRLTVFDTDRYIPRNYICYIVENTVFIRKRHVGALLALGLPEYEVKLSEGGYSQEEIRSITYTLSTILEQCKEIIMKRKLLRMKASLVTQQLALLDPVQGAVVSALLAHSAKQNVIDCDSIITDLVFQKSGRVKPVIKTILGHSERTLPNPYVEYDKDPTLIEIRAANTLDTLVLIRSEISIKGEDMNMRQFLKAVSDEFLECILPVIGDSHKLRLLLSVQGLDLLNEGEKMYYQMGLDALCGKQRVSLVDASVDVFSYMANIKKAVVVGPRDTVTADCAKFERKKIPVYGVINRAAESGDTVVPLGYAALYGALLTLKLPDEIGMREINDAYMNVYYCQNISGERGQVLCEQIGDVLRSLREQASIVRSKRSFYSIAA